MSDPKILPYEKAQTCPFCGCQPEIEHWHGGGPNKRMVSCVNPGCGPAPSVTGETEKEALDKWNRRGARVMKDCSWKPIDTLPEGTTVLFRMVTEAGDVHYFVGANSPDINPHEVIDTYGDASIGFDASVFDAWAPLPA